jgi:hypothetical protein
MDGNGANGIDHSERILRVEVATNQLATQQSAQGEQLKSLEKAFEVSENHILEKLDDVSKNLSDKLTGLSTVIEKTVLKEGDTEKRLDEMETKAKVTNKIKNRLWGLILAAASGAASLIAEQLIRHGH